MFSNEFMYSSIQSVCSKRITSDRFDESTNNESSEFLERLSRCNNYSLTNFTISDCFFLFNVEFSLYFNLSENVNENKPQFYFDKIIDGINFTLNESLIFFELSTMDKKLYISVNKTDDICENENNCNISLILNKISDIKLELSNFSQNSNQIITSNFFFIES